MKRKRANFDEIVEYCRSPSTFLKYLDRCGVDRAALINYVAPEVIGFTNAVNQFVADYTKHDPKRLISCGSLHPRHTTNIMADVEHLARPIKKEEFAPTRRDHRTAISLAASAVRSRSFSREALSDSIFFCVPA